jgi:transcriptional regulator with XRE-family HTH domain
MPKEIPGGTVVTVLRVVRGWGQGELAAAAGLRTASVSDYERGKKPLPHRTLERLVAAMGFPASLVARTSAFIDEAREAASPTRAGGAIPELVEAAAAGFGREVADFLRAGLTRLLADVTLLEARCRAPFLWERLRTYSRTQQRAIVQENPEFHSWALCELLCEESVKAAADKPKRAAELADLSLAIARLIPGEEGWRARQQGYVWAFAGNARRALGDLAGADEAFSRSGELWRQGASPFPEPLDELRLLDLEAALRREQRRLPEALMLLDRALALAQRQDIARLLLLKAETLAEMRDPEGAVATLRRAAPFLDREAEPDLLLRQRFHLLESLARTDRFAEARTLLPEIRELVAGLGNGLDLVRLRWLEGRIAAGLDDFPTAAEALRQVRADLVDRGIAYDTAMVTLELAALLAREDRSQEVKDLARHSAPLFQAQEIHPEALAALAVFRRAAERRTLTAETAREILEFLRAARLDTTLQFTAGRLQDHRDSDPSVS